MEGIMSSVPNVIDLRIPTAALRTILDENPEVRLKLDAMACEKIAEELTRKAKSVTIVNFEKTLENAVARAESSFNSLVVKKYSFPPAAREVITAICKEELEKQTLLARESLIRKANELVAIMKESLDKYLVTKVSQEVAKFPALIKIHARAEFVEVLESVRSK
jgi:hypothetical protein